MNEEQKRLARDLGALAHRLSSEPLFGPWAKAGDEVVLAEGTRLVLAEDADNGKYTVEARVTLAPELAARVASCPRLPRRRGPRRRSRSRATGLRPSGGGCAAPRGLPEKSHEQALPRQL